MNPEEDEEEYNPWAPVAPAAPEALPSSPLPITEEADAEDESDKSDDYNPWAVAQTQAPAVEENADDYNPWASQEPTEEPSEALPGELAPATESLTADAVKADTERMGAIRDYMIRRKGKQYQSMEDGEIYDDFINHMRFFNTNEVITATELTWLYNLEDDKKGVATKAYQVYDELGNMFTNDGWMGAVDGVVDYTRAVLTSPSTYAGAVVGRVAIGSATQATKTAAIKTAVTMARKAAVKEAAKKGITGTAARQLGREAGEQVLADTARAVAVKQVLVATGVDATANSFQDYMYQSAKIEGEAQDTYSFLQTGLAAAGGFLGGSVAMIPHMTRGASGLLDAEAKIQQGASRAAVAKFKKAAPEMQKAAAAFQTEMIDWVKTVKKGKRVAKDSMELREKALSLLLDPDPNSKTSVTGAMMRAGIGVDMRENAAKGSQQIVSFALSLPKKEITAMNKLFTKEVGVSYTKFVEILAATASEGGTTMNLWSQAVKRLGGYAAAAKEADDIILQEGGKKAAKEIEPKTIEYVQSLWRRLLVSHPATTAVNVQGWAQAYGARSLAEVIHGGILGTAGVVAKIASPVTGTTFADEALRKSGHLFAAQVFKLKNLVDPYTTREAAEEIFKSAPKKSQERLQKGVFGGVALETPAMYGMRTDNKVIKWAEGYADRAGKIAAVKVQDTYTKSFSILSALDKGTRLKYNKSLSEMLNTGKMADIDDDVWNAAIEAGLKDTFSADYTKGYGTLSHLADFAETMSNTPGVGFLFPFGRFLNNNLAFVMQYSPVALYPIYNNMRKKGLMADDTLEGMSKMIVGMSALASLGVYQNQKAEQGLAWNQEMDLQGDVVDRSNMAPGSAYLALGRAVGLIMNGEKITEGLFRDMGDQLGPSKLLRDIGTVNPIGGVVEYLFGLNDDEAERREFVAILGEIAKSAIGDIGSGFTRPFDVPNTMIGLVAGNDITPDRRMAKGVDGVIQGATRYVDNIFAPFLGEPLEEGGPRVIGKPQQAFNQMGPVTDVGPISRMVGNKLVAPLSNIDRILASVNLPAWGQQERTGIPEWDYIMNERVTPLLEAKASALITSEVWKKANLRKREFLVQTLLKDAKGEMRTFIANQGPKENLLNERRKFSILNENLRAMAKKALGINKPDTELTLTQIESLKFWMDNQKDMADALIE